MTIVGIVLTPFSACDSRENENRDRPSSIILVRSEFLISWTVSISIALIFYLSINKITLVSVIIKLKLINSILL